MFHIGAVLLLSYYEVNLETHLTKGQPSPNKIGAAARGGEHVVLPGCAVTRLEAIALESGGDVVKEHQVVVNH